jgi:hypothetical protein
MGPVQHRARLRIDLVVWRPRAGPRVGVEVDHVATRPRDDARDPLALRALPETIRAEVAVFAKRPREQGALGEPGVLRRARVDHHPRVGYFDDERERRLGSNNLEMRH